MSKARQLVRLKRGGRGKRKGRDLPSVGIDGLEDALDGLELHLGGLLGELEGADADHVLAGGRLEPQLNLPLGLRLARHLRMEKSPKTNQNDEKQPETTTTTTTSKGIEKGGKPWGRG